MVPLAIHHTQPSLCLVFLGSTHVTVPHEGRQELTIFPSANRWCFSSQTSCIMFLRNTTPSVGIYYLKYYADKYSPRAICANHSLASSEHAKAGREGHDREGREKKDKTKRGSKQGESRHKCEAGDEAKMLEPVDLNFIDWTVRTTSGGEAGLRQFLWDAKSPV
ncbi:hypothetical protein BJX64DRAFT_151750 [Aspergillus heterothallicus]